MFRKLIFEQVPRTRKRVKWKSVEWRKIDFLSQKSWWKLFQKVCRSIPKNHAASFNLLIFCHSFTGRKISTRKYRGFWSHIFLLKWKLIWRISDKNSTKCRHWSRSGSKSTSFRGVFRYWPSRSGHGSWTIGGLSSPRWKRTHHFRETNVCFFCCAMRGSTQCRGLFRKRLRLSSNQIPTSTEWRISWRLRWGWISFFGRSKGFERIVVCFDFVLIFPFQVFTLRWWAYWGFFNYFYKTVKNMIIFVFNLTDFLSHFHFPIFCGIFAFHDTTNSHWFEMFSLVTPKIHVQKMTAAVSVNFPRSFLFVFWKPRKIWNPLKVTTISVFSMVWLFFGSGIWSHNANFFDRKVFFWRKVRIQ